MSGRTLNHYQRLLEMAHAHAPPLARSPSPSLSLSLSRPMSLTLLTSVVVDDVIHCTDQTFSLTYALNRLQRKLQQLVIHRSRCCSGWR